MSNNRKYEDIHAMCLYSFSNLFSPSFHLDSNIIITTNPIFKQFPIPQDDEKLNTVKKVHVNDSLLENYSMQ
jgi:hypothetical protein